jgi:hypothetical protein
LAAQQTSTATPQRRRTAAANLATHSAGCARSRWVLADDGIIDPIAIEIAVRGIRPVALTAPERRAATTRILARGGTLALVSKRLRVSGSTAAKLANQCRQAQATTS